MNDGVAALRRSPAFQALAIQCISFVCVLAVAHAMAALSQMQLSIAAAALLQGAISACFSRLCGMARWWRYMHFLFAPALVLAQALWLPSWIYLAAFLALASLYWNVYRTQVPFYPSGPAVWRAVADLLPAERPICFIDIGSGLGGLPLCLAERREESRFIGIELAPLPWLISVARSWIRRSGARFLRGDYSRLNLVSYDVVFAYLSPAAMPDLWRKARAEMRPGTLLLSHEFAVPGIVPDVICTPAPGGPPLYGWRM